MLLPQQARAFWLWSFSTSADAAVSPTPPDSSTPVLRASTNLDPNPNKGGSVVQTSGNRALLAYNGPGGTPADIASEPPSDRISVYEVKSGDTLSEIADMYDVSVNTIIWANDLRGVNDLHKGDILIILPISGVERVVVKGDTLKSLAKKFGGDANEIAQYNGLDPAAPLAIGSTVIIPGGEISAAVPVSSGPGRVTKQPLRGGGGAVFTGYFGNPVPGAILTQALHGWNGIDLGAARGTPVYAAADGVVIISRSNGGWNGGFGNYIVITHDNGSQTLYSHLRSAITSFGQGVSRGQLIGYVGATGRTTGPHLHFEVRGAANPFRNCSVGSVCSPQ